MTNAELKQLDLDQVLERLQYAVVMAKAMEEGALLRSDPTLPTTRNFRLELGDFVVTSRFPDPQP